MQRNLITGLAGLVIGLVIGFFGSNALNRSASVETQASSSLQAPAQPGTEASKEMLADVSEMLSKAESEPQNFAVQMRAGDMYARIGRFEKAIEFYTRGIALKPTDLNANVVLANAYFDSGQFEKAADHYSKALEIDPKSVDARTDLGATFVERKTPDYDRAIDEFNRALGIDPNHAPTLYYLGVTQFRKGNVAEAQKMLARLQESNQNSDLAERLRKNLESGAAPTR